MNDKAVLNAMILTAGEGTRLRPYTLNRPKPLIPFLGCPLVNFSLALLEDVKVKNLVYNTFYLADQVDGFFQNENFHAENICGSSESSLLLGSGGGIHNAEKYLKGTGDFLVTNGDEIILPHRAHAIKDLISTHKWNKGIATLLTMKHSGVGKEFGGAWINAQGEVQLFSKTQPTAHGQKALQGLHYIGVIILSERIFEYFKPRKEDGSVEIENILYETLTSAIAAGEKVHTHTIECEWFEVGNPKSFVDGTKFCLEALQSGKDEYWIQYLRQVLNWYSKREIFIEKDFPFLRKDLEDIFR